MASRLPLAGRQESIIDSAAHSESTATGNIISFSLFARNRIEYTARVCIMILMAYFPTAPQQQHSFTFRVIGTKQLRTRFHLVSPSVTRARHVPSSSPGHRIITRLMRLIRQREPPLRCSDNIDPRAARAAQSPSCLYIPAVIAFFSRGDT